MGEKTEFLSAEAVAPVKLHGGDRRRKPWALALVAFMALALALACASVPSGQAEAASATTTSVKIGSKTFKMKLASGAPAKAFRSYLNRSRTLKMSELNGNEKYRYFSTRTFPTNEKRYKKVRAGDVMLYGDDCLVIFYKTHKTSYKYTKIGRLTSTKGLARAAGKKSVNVRFSKMKQPEKQSVTTGKEDSQAAATIGSDNGSAAPSAPESDAAPAGGDASNASESPEEPASSMELPVWIDIRVGDETMRAKLEDNPSAKAFAEQLGKGDITVSMHDYGNFEKVGPLGATLPRTDETITTAPGDIILYQGNQVTIYYDENTWSFTRLGKIEGATRKSLLSVLGIGDVDVTFSLSKRSPGSLAAGEGAIS